MQGGLSASGHCQVISSSLCPAGQPLPKRHHSLFQTWAWEQGDTLSNPGRPYTQPSPCPSAHRGLSATSRHADRQLEEVSWCICDDTETCSRGPERSRNGPSISASHFRRNVFIYLKLETAELRLAASSSVCDWGQAHVHPIRKPTTLGIYETETLTRGE